MLLIILFAFFYQVASASPPCTFLENDRCIQVQNNCPLSIFPAIRMQVGNQTSYDGFFLLSRDHKNYYFPTNVTYLQVWARTECSTSGPFECATGDCGRNVQCNEMHKDTPPISMAEIWPNPTGVEKYAVTLFNGFNVPVKITPSVITPVKFLDRGLCPTLGACNHTLSLTHDCPEELLFVFDDVIEGCFHPCAVYNRPEYCCTGEYARSQKCFSTIQTSAYAGVFKTTCPTARTSPFDTPVKTCLGVHPLNVFYTINFC